MNTKHIWRHALIAGVGYWLLGSATNFFSIPPGFASPIWPAAGFAYFMLLAIGKGTLLGIFFASFCLNVSFSGASLVQPSMAWVSAACIAFGAVCQALVAVYLVKRFTLYPKLNTRAFDGMLLGLLGGPVACLISASIGVATLNYFGVVSTSELAINWLYWWVGDSIGVLIAAPLIVLFAVGYGWSHKARVVLFLGPYIGLTAIVVFLFDNARETEQTKLEQVFREKANGMQAALLKQTDNITHAGQNLASMFMTFDDISYEQFQRFTQGVLEATPGSYAFGWVPEVPDSKRSAFESNMTEQLGRPFRFLDRSTGGEMVPAAKRDTYFPVYYVYPLFNNEKAEGFNLASHSGRLGAIKKALTTNNYVITEPIILVNEDSSQNSFILFTPVISDRRAERSLIASVYRVDNFVAAALDARDRLNIAVSIRDISDINNPKYLYRSEVEGQLFKYRIKLPYAGRVWEMVYAPTAQYIRANQGVSVWVVLIFGLLVVTVIGLFVLQLISRNVAIEMEVEHKTRALHMALEESKHANLAKSKFLACMSHEIRTPMNGVLGMLKLLVKSPLNENQKNQAAIAQESAESLLVLINDILDFSKIESGKLDFEELEFKIIPWASSVVEGMAQSFQSRQIELILDVSRLHHSSAISDPGRLRQVLNNLLSNALKFTLEGEVTVKVFSEDVDNQHFKISCEVQDTGIGIAQDKLSLLFDSFSQVDASTTRKFGGTGLGLAISKDLCELMGGELSVMSEEGVGSCFRFSAIVNKCENTKIINTSGDQTFVEITEKRILIVDNNLAHCQALSKQLSLWGCVVKFVTHGSQAITLLNEYEGNAKDKPYDMIFLDWLEADKSGANLLIDSLKERPSWHGVHIIFMSSVSHAASVPELHPLGSGALYTKPTTPADLLNVLSKVSVTPLAFDTGIFSSQTKPVELAEWLVDTRVLLVEDNRVNQEVVIGLLSDDGFNIDTANNGEEALSLLRLASSQSPYDVILMDCHMPEMDGFEATALIRKGLAGKHNIDIPIIALTANAMTGDREACLAAGMSDYLPKPIEPEALDRALRRWIKPDSSDSDLQPHSAKQSDLRGALSSGNARSDTHDIWDKTAALKRVRHREDRLKILIKSFLEEFPAQVGSIREGIEKRSYEDVRSLAHSFKGVTGNLSANQLMATAYKLEQAALSEDLNSLDVLLIQFDADFASFKSVVEGEFD